MWLGECARWVVHFKSFVPRTRSKAVFVVVMACYSVALSNLVNALIRANGSRPPAAFYLWMRHPVFYVLDALVLAPVLESLILIAVVEGAKRAGAPTLIQVFVAAWVISFMHAWPWAPHAIIVFPAFCVQAGSYLYWRRTTWKAGFGVLVAIHVLCNVIPTIGVIGYALRRA